MSALPTVRWHRMQTTRACVDVPIAGRFAAEQSSSGFADRSSNTRMASPRRVWVFFAAAIALTAFLFVRWLYWDPAPDLRKLVSSVPTPVGVHPDRGVEVTGHRPPRFPSCYLDCQTEVATQSWIANDSSVDVCRALRASVKRWEAVGFQESAPNRHEVLQPQACDVAGNLLGHPAGAEALPAVGGEAAFITFAMRW